MPNLARGVSPGRAPQLSAKKPPPVKGVGPTAGKYGGIPQKAPPMPSKPSPATGRNLQGTFGPLAKKGVGAPSKLAPPQYQKYGASTGRSPLGEVGHFISRAVEGAYPKGKPGKGKGAIPGAVVTAGTPVGNEVHPLEALKNLPGSTERLFTGIPGAIEGIGKIAVELPQGKTAGAEKFGKALGQIAEHPGEFLNKEPASALAMALGGAGGASRVAGAAARAGLAGEKAAAWAEKGAVAKGYGGISVVKPAERGVLGKLGREGVDTFRKAVLHQDPGYMYGNRLKKAVSGGGMTGIVNPSRVDLGVGRAKGLTQLLQAKHGDFLHHVIKTLPSKAHREALGMALEGTLKTPRTIVDDLARRREELVEARGGLTTNLDKKRNDVMVKRIERLENDKQFIENPEPTFAAAHTIAKAQQPLFRKMVSLGHFESNQEHAALIPFALSHGHLLDRGPLKLVTEPGMHPLIGERNAIQQRIVAAQKELANQKEKLAHAEGRRAGVKFMSQPGLKSTYDQPSHLRWAVDDAKSELALARKAKQGNKEALAQARANGEARLSGEMYPHLQDREGNRVSYQDIQRLADKELGRPVGFLTHKDEVLRSNLQMGASRGRVGTAIRSRTGEHYRQGLYDASVGAIHKEFNKAAFNIASHQSENAFINEFGLGRPGHEGAYLSKDPVQLEKLARDLNASPAHKRVVEALGKYRVVSVGPDKILDKGLIDVHPAFHDIQQYGKAETAQEGKYALIPEKVLARREAHMHVSEPGEIAQKFRSLTGYWRHAALYATPRWPIGVTQENAIRLAMHRITPFAMFNTTRGLSRNYKIGEALTTKFSSYVGDEMRGIAGDPHTTEAEKVAAQMHAGAAGQGNLMGAAARTAMHDEDPGLLEEYQSRMEAFAGHYGPKEIAGAWDWWKHKVGDYLQNMETNARTAAMGNIAKQDLGFFTSWRKMMKDEGKLVDQYARGTLDPNEAALYSQRLMDIMGNWTNLTPFTRRAQQSWSPFGLWWLNSVKFLFKTMPKDHPVATGLWAALVAGTGADERHGFKKGSTLVNMPFVGPVDASFIHYSPLDIAHEATKTAVSMAMPLESEAALRTLGLNPLTLDKISQASQEPEEGEGVGEAGNLAAAAEHAAIQMTPFGNAALGIAKRGGSAEPKSLNPVAIKPGSARGSFAGLAKFLSPVPFTYPPKTDAGKERKAVERPERKGRPERKERKVRER